MIESLPVLPILLFLSCLVALAAGAARHRWQVAVLAGVGLLGLVVSVLYAGIDQLTGNGLSAAVFYHLEQDTEGAGIGEFAGLAATLAALLLLAIVTTVWAVRRGRGRRGPGLTWPALLFGVLGFTVHPLSSDVIELLEDRGTAQGALAEHFATPPERLGGPQHNLVVLYLESYEQAYFDPARFPGVAPRLSAWMAEAEQFSDLRQVWSTEWTIAGMVASQCGMPLVTTGGLGNSMHSTTRFLPGATCLGDLLAGAGYRTAYVGGAKLSFSGKGTFYASHGVADRTGLKRIIAERGPETVHHRWGTHDDTTLDVFRERFDAFAAGDAPFALFGLTLDTHHPVGHISPRCVAALPESLGNPMRDAARCTDFLVGELLEHIAASPAADNTVVVVLSDHLAMPNEVSEVLREQPRRNVLAIRTPGRAPAVHDRPGSTLDTAAIIANSLDPAVDAFGLGRNLRTQESITADNRLGGQRLSAWAGDLRHFWRLPGSLDDLRYRDGALIAGSNLYKLPVAIAVDADGGLDGLLFHRERRQTFRTLEGRRGILLDRCFALAIEGRPDMPGPDWCLYVQDPERGIQLGGPLGTGTLTFDDGLDGLVEDADDLDLRPAGLHYGGRFWSQGGWTRRSGYLHPLDPLQHVWGGRGLNLFRIAPDGSGVTLLEAVDTCALGTAEDPAVPVFAERIAADDRPDHFYVVVGHDAVWCEGKNLTADVLAGLPFDPAAINYRSAFIGAVDGTGAKHFEAASRREGNVNLRVEDLVGVEAPLLAALPEPAFGEAPIEPAAGDDLP